MAEPAKYVYKPLLQRKSSDGTQGPTDASKNYLPIRILNLFAGELDDSLKGELVNRQDESYEALSYHWGDVSEPAPPLLIHEEGHVYQIRLTRNLESALRHLRHRSRPRRLWVDAICINQEDNRDKGFQIPFMGRIYAEASDVSVWLGDSHDDSELAFKFIESVLKLSDLDQLIDERFIDSWAALSSLMKRDWFSRRWIVQEIAFAKSATVRCGQSCIEWPELADAMAIFASRAEEISKLFRGARKYKYRSDFLGDVEAHGANRLVEITSRLFRKSDDGRALEPLLSLEALVSTLSAFQATKPHDIIYAVLSLASDIIATAEPASVSQKRHDSVTRRENREAKAWSRDAAKSLEGLGMRETAEAVEVAPSGEPEALHEPPESSTGTQSPSKEIQKRNAERFVGLLRGRVRHKIFHVDYEKKTFYEVCEDFIAFSIKSSQSLDMLCRPWAPDVEDLPDGDRDDLPSWICPLSKSPFRPRPDGNYDRVNADLLVGDPESRPKLYNSARGTAPEFHRFVDRRLYVHGFVLDTVSDLKSPAIEGNIPHEWLAFGGWSKLKEQPPESFWRTLVADRDEKGHNPPSYYGRACRQSFSQRTPGGSLNTTNLINNHERNKIMTDYLKRVQSVVWMKKLMKSAGHDGEKLIGLVPNEAEKGDLICIVRGCSVPLLLRKTADAGSEHFRSESKLKQVIPLPRQKFGLSLRSKTFQHPSSSIVASMRDDKIAENEETVRKSTEDVADALTQTNQSNQSKLRRHGTEMAAFSKMNNDTQVDLERRPQSAPLTRTPERTLAEFQRNSSLRSKIPVPRKTFGENGVSKAVMAFRLSIPCRLIGECYIHGIMDGEAFRLRDKWDIDEAEFELH
ncbi:hypothetical protein GJ744_002286 [Endocarpon pusillum]|uniref:Heterokaryon incompatibility domain-containing protein n=1 Tax=Endocarpon pusillum TaxID=364733 RepID=A0A8H7E6D1_9EURO|nr:hypothetical protein GJ744_002286 [Endocarpon pusillum]